MDNETTIATAAVAQAALALAGVISTLILGLVVYKSTSRIARLEHARSMRETWVTIDGLALADPTTLTLADALLPQPPHPDASFARKRWFVLAYLNPIATAHQGAIDGIYGPEKDDVVAGIRAQLATLLRDDDVFWVTQNHGHEASFQALCRTIRDGYSKAAD